MKTAKSLERSARARLNEAKRSAITILDTITAIQSNGFNADRMAELRSESEALLLCVHEYNAYSNSLLTD